MQTSAAAATEYLREGFGRMDERYVGICLDHAWAIAARLAEEGRRPTIALLRDVSQHGETRYHGPLIALRYLGRGSVTWTTHYVCCCDGYAYDPLFREPVPLAGYAVAAFGRELALETFAGEDA